MRFTNDSQRRAVFANLNRFSAFPSDNVLSTPPSYVYDGGYDNTLDKNFSSLPPYEAEERAELYKKLAATFRRAENKTKDMGLKAKLDIEGKIFDKKAADLVGGGSYQDPWIGDDEKRNEEVRRNGGMVYVTAPDTPEDFRKYEDEQRRKLDKRFAEDPKKKGKQAVFGVAVGDDELTLSTREISDEKEITPKGTQVYFGDDYKAGRKGKKSEFARMTFDDMRVMNKERLALLSEINNSNMITKERRSEIVKRLDQIYDILEVE